MIVIIEASVAVEEKCIFNRNKLKVISKAILIAMFRDVKLVINLFFNRKNFVSINGTKTNSLSR